jgi:hypothetical protein
MASPGGSSVLAGTSKSELSNRVPACGKGVPVVPFSTTFEDHPVIERALRSPLGTRREPPHVFYTLARINQRLPQDNCWRKRTSMVARDRGYYAGTLAMPGRKGMLLNPSISVSNVQEPIKDEVGQQWSPATIAIEWPRPTGPTARLEAPTLQIRVIASYRPDMTVEELRQAHFSAALDVLSSALLALEKPVDTAAVRMPSARV